ncbi:hypothetical protein SEA_ATUIN_271 [Arthrobacter phage Atuin]|nr:hypothetical protein SEA_ATUIN_70 [Arthrobacter phage Atuin]
MSEVKEMYVTEYRKALVRKLKARKALAAAEAEDHEATTIHDALETLVGKNPFTDCLTTDRASHLIYSELSHWFDENDPKTSVRGMYLKLLEFVDTETSWIDEAMKQGHHPDVVDLLTKHLSRNIPEWRIVLRVSFDEDVTRFVKHFAPLVGLKHA